MVFRKAAGWGSLRNGVFLPYDSAPLANISIGGGGPPSSTTTGIVANRFQVPTATVSYTAPITSRRHHWASGAGNITDIRCVDVGWEMTSTTIDAGASRTIKRFIEYPAGTFHQVTWAASPTVAVSGKTVYTSDVVISSVTTLPLVIPAGERFWERTVLTTGSSAPCLVAPASQTTLGTGDGTVNGDFGDNGTVSANASVNSHGSTAMIGTINAADARNVLVIGDSIIFGVGDETSVGSKGGSGWFARWMDLTTTPYVKIARGGYAANNAANGANVATDITNFVASLTFSDYVNELGVNDQTTGRTLAQITADINAILAFPSNAGKTARIWQTTITPRTDSTDSWATAINQTTKTDGTTLERPILNWLARTGGFTRQTGFIDVADVTMTTRDSGIWSGSFPPVLDGVHPTSARVAEIGSAVTWESGFESYSYPVPVLFAAPGAPSGTPQVGIQLTAQTGVWWNAPVGSTTFAYTWRDDGVTIGGATANTFTPTASEQGGVITTTSLPTNAGGPAASAAVSAGTSPVAAAGPWYTSGSYADIDYENDRAWVNGVEYASIADARTATAITAVGSYDSMPLPTLAASYSYAVKGVTGSVAPSSGSLEALLTLGDAAGTATDEYSGLIWTNASGTVYLGLQLIDGGTSQTLAPASAGSHYTTTGAGINTPYRMAGRLKLNSILASVNGATTGNEDTSATLPTLTQLLVGRREDGTRIATGPIHRVVFVNSELNQTQLNSLLA